MIGYLLRVIIRTFIMFSILNNFVVSYFYAKIRTFDKMQ